jgi:hypothetical protein
MEVDMNYAHALLYLFICFIALTDKIRACWHASSFMTLQRIEEKKSQQMRDSERDRETATLGKSSALSLTANNVLCKCQIGFLPNYRTIDHIFTLHTLIDKQINKPTKRKAKCLLMFFADFKKAD